MEVLISDISYDEKPVLRNLLELYQHDHSEFDGADVDVHGFYGYRYLDHYWTEEGRTPLWIRVDGKIAGFALNRCYRAEGEESAHSVAEFFVLRKYRRQGVGRAAMRQVFTRLPGTWHIEFETKNTGASVFWRHVANEAAGSAVEEVDLGGRSAYRFRTT